MHPKLAAALKDLEKAVQNATEIADEVGESFYFCPSYGMGGTYYPKKKNVQMTRDEALDKLESGAELSEEERKAIAALLSGEADDDDGWVSSEEGWYASSLSC